MFFMEFEPITSNRILFDERKLKASEVWSAQCPKERCIIPYG